MFDQRSRGTVRITTEDGELLHEGLEHRDLYAFRVPVLPHTVTLLSTDYHPDFGCYFVEEPLTVPGYHQFLQTINLVISK